MKSTSDKNTGFRLHDVRLKPHEQIGSHRQSTWELSYITRGSGIRTIGELSESFHAGDLVLVPPNIYHAWNFDRSNVDDTGRISNLTLILEPLLFDNLSSVFPELGESLAKIRSYKSAVKFGGAQAERIKGLLGSLRGRTTARRVSTVIEILLAIAADRNLEILDCGESLGSVEERLKKIDIYMSCNLRRPVSIDDVARHVGMNRAAFCTFYKRHAGRTFITALNDRRLSEACRMLVETSLPVSEIGYMVGFQSIPHFNHLFHRSYGTSPKAYRAAHSNG